MNEKNSIISIITLLIIISCTSTQSQIGQRFPSEKKVVKDPLTGVQLTFLTSTPVGDSKIYQTHPQWTSDGQWVIFRSRRVEREVMAVNEQTGVIVQVSEGGYRGGLNISRKEMKLYFMRNSEEDRDIREVWVVNLEKLFKDSEANTLQDASEYQKRVGTIPTEYNARGDAALDAGEEWLWFAVGNEKALEQRAGPGGIAGISVKTGEIKYVTSVPFQVGHIQSNPWVPGQIVFCWETGGKAPQRTWIVNGDGKGLRPLYPEAAHEWVTHEVVITPDEVAFAIMGHRPVPGLEADAPAATDPRGANPGQEAEWGNSGTREKPTGLGIVNIKTREMRIEAQTKSGSGLWHVNGTADGRFAVGDDFARDIYLIDRHSGEMLLLSAGHKTTARNHPHPSFSPDGTRIHIQSAMLSEDDKSMNICIIPVPEDWLKRIYE
jgi:oligogalacturonide lyase